MWYTGTKAKCIAYNSMVSNEMGLGTGLTQSWAKVIKHHSKSVFAIAKHPDYDQDDLTLIDELPSDWFPDEQL